VFKGHCADLHRGLSLALMTTYPAQALLGKLTSAHALLPDRRARFCGIARFVWKRALRAYTSASS